MHFFGKISDFLKGIYVTGRLYYLGSIIVILFVMGQFIPIFFIVAKSALLLLLACIILNILLLFENIRPVEASRHVARRLSNSDNNKISIRLKNYYRFKVQLRIIDEIPHQFQIRDFEIRTEIHPGQEKIESYFYVLLSGANTILGISIFTLTML